MCSIVIVHPSALPIVISPAISKLRLIPPTFDPNLLSSTNTASANSARSDLLNQADNPLISRATNEIYAPGSTFKLVTAAAALEQAGFTLETPVFEITATYVLC